MSEYFVSILKKEQPNLIHAHFGPSALEILPVAKNLAFSWSLHFMATTRLQCYGIKVIKRPACRDVEDSLGKVLVRGMEIGNAAKIGKI